MAPGFSEFDRRNSPRDGAYYLYLHTPRNESQMWFNSVCLSSNRIKELRAFHIAVLQSKPSGDEN